LSFSGHQTFPLRYGWISKGVNQAIGDATAFFRDDAMTTLGVGKNMVASIRHWCETLGLIDLDGRTGRGEATALGSSLFGPAGLDPFLESPGTLWFIQWQLTKCAERASAWHFMFTRWSRVLFSRDESVAWLLDAAKQAGDARTSPASMRRDVDVFVRTYVPSRSGESRSSEDSFDSPLVELALIRELDNGVYQLQRGPKPSLPIEVLALAVDEYWRRTASEQSTLSFERVMYGPGSPGGAFQLSDPALSAMLEKLPAWTGLRYDESAGLRRLVREGRRKAGGVERFLRRYYRHDLSEAS
jgi:hypothetical protein